MRRVIAAAMIAGASAVCFAAPEDYQCVISEELTLRGDGSLSRYAKPLNIGERFAVNRSTGEVVGGPFIRASITKTTLIDSGSSANAFKAVYITLSDAEILQIEEFAEGKEKPFVAVTLLTVLSGVCK